MSESNGGSAGNGAYISTSLSEDALVLGSFFKDLKQQGIPPAIAGNIVGELYKRIRLPVVGDDDE